MSSDEWWTIKWIFNGISAATTLVGCVLAVWAAVTIQQADSPARIWFRNTSNALQATRLPRLPGALIRWLIQRRAAFDQLSRWGLTTWTGVIVMGVAAASVLFMVPVRSPFSPMYLILCSLLMWGAEYVNSHTRFSRVANAMELVGVVPALLFAALLIWSAFSWFGTSSSTWFEAVVAIAILPLCLVMADSTRSLLDAISIIFRGSPVIADDETFLRLGAFALGAGSSVVTTVGSLWLGNTANPGFILAPSAQLLVSNLVFDGLTVLITLLAFQYLRTLLAIVTVLAVAAVFACLSLWLGVLGTEDQLSLRETLRIFVATTPDGSAFFIGAPFWVMHSTFIPTVMFLTVLSVTVAGKAAVEALSSFTRRAEAPEINPVAVIATTFAACVALLQIAAQGAAFMEETAARAEKKKEHVTAVVPANAARGRGIDGLILSSN